MLQVQNLFALTIAAWMLSHQPTLMMNLDSRWQHSHSRFKTCSQRRRVEIGSRLHAALFVHLPEILFRQFEVFALQRLQVWLFKFEHFSGGLLAFADYAREIFPAAFQQRFIQCRHIASPFLAIGSYGMTIGLMSVYVFLPATIV